MQTNNVTRKYLDINERRLIEFDIIFGIGLMAMKNSLFIPRCRQIIRTSGF